MPGDRKNRALRTPAETRRPAPARLPAPAAPRPPAPIGAERLPFGVASTVTRPAVADSLKAAAPQAALRGEHRRALDLYRSLSALEPTVPLHRIRAGDCLVKLDRRREALVEYRSAAEAYTSLGLLVHARSAWRLVLGIAPGDADAGARLRALDARTRAARVPPPPPVIVPAGGILPPSPPAGAPSRPPPVAIVPVSSPAPAQTPATPVVVPRADVGHGTSAGADRTGSLRALGLEPLARGAELVGEDEFCPATGHTVTGRAAMAVAPPPSRERLALEFADLDDDADVIWIDLEAVHLEQRREEGWRRPARRGGEDREPVAFFREEDLDPAPTRAPSRPSGELASGLVEEPTRPVPPPESGSAPGPDFA